jgi:hypothetical protein
MFKKENDTDFNMLKSDFNMLKSQYEDLLAKHKELQLEMHLNDLDNDGHDLSVGDPIPGIIEQGNSMKLNKQVDMQIECMSDQDDNVSDIGSVGSKGRPYNPSTTYINIPKNVTKEYMDLISVDESLIDPVNKKLYKDKINIIDLTTLIDAGYSYKAFNKWINGKLVSSKVDKYRSYL